MQIGVETQQRVETSRVFVVDHDGINRAVLQFMLQDEYETHDLPDLAACYATGETARPDLLLLGLSLVRAEPGLLPDLAARWPRLRILLIAEPGEDQDAHDALGRHAHGVLAKPFTVEAVRRKAGLQFGRGTPSLVQLFLAPVAAP